MTLDQIVAAHNAKQQAILAALRKGIAGHEDPMPINVQCGDLRAVITLLDETKDHADDLARQLAGSRPASPE